MNWLRDWLRGWLGIDPTEFATMEYTRTRINTQYAEIQNLQARDSDVATRLQSIESYIAATRKKDREEELAEQLAQAQSEIARLSRLLPRDEPEGPYRAKSWADARNYRG